MSYVKVHHERLRQIKDALRESGWLRMGEFGPYEHADYRDEHVQEAERLTLETLDRVDELIDVLGLRDEYADETTSIYRSWSPDGGSSPYYETTTVRGVHRFLTDVHAAHEASTGAEALARIRSVLGKK